jgi:ribose transport system ATP-binding protein
MIKKELYSDYLVPARPINNAKVLLEVRNLSYRNRVNDVSLDLKAGEIVGLAGLLGSGRTELLECIAGIRRADRGQVIVNGKPLKNGKPWIAIERGIFLVPENRHRCGVIGIHTLAANMMMPIWRKFRGAGPLLDDKKAAKMAEVMRQKMDINSTGIQQTVNTLSGGNQQKVVFAKGLLTEPKILLLDDPTAGIDVDTKSSIAKLIRETADAGNGIVIVSSEFDELARLCDRVLIMRKGAPHTRLIRGTDTITEVSLNHAVQAV